MSGSVRAEQDASISVDEVCFLMRQLLALDVGAEVAQEVGLVPKQASVQGTKLHLLRLYDTLLDCVLATDNPKIKELVVSALRESGRGLGVARPSAGDEV